MRAFTLFPTLLCTVLLSAAAQAMTLRMPAPGDDVVGEVTMVQIARTRNTLNDYARAYGFGFAS